ncbi:ribosome maturation factor RimM [Desulfocurvus sp. DL9XJH121]
MSSGGKDFVLIAEIAKPHGIRGEVSVIYHGDSPLLLEHVPALFLRPGNGTRPPRRARVASWRPHQGRVLARFEGVEDRDAAEALRGHEILVRPEDLPEPGEDELYLYEIEGLTVLLEDGSVLGEIAEVVFPGGQEVWSVRTPDGREVLLPVAEEFVTDVDLDEGRVTVAPPPGLLDIYLGES